MSSLRATPEVIENDLGMMSDLELEQHTLNAGQAVVAEHVQRRHASVRSACILVLCLGGLASGVTRDAMQAACPNLTLPAEASLLTISALMLRRFLQGSVTDTQFKRMVEEFPDEMRLVILEEREATEDNETKAVLDDILGRHFPQYQYGESQVAREWNSFESLPSYAA